MAAFLPRFRRKIPVMAIACAALCSIALRAFAIPYPSLHRAQHPLVVGYFTNSTIYSKTPFYVKALVTSGSASRLDQIDYASASVQGGHCSLADPTADLMTLFSAENSVNGVADDPNAQFHGYFHQLAELKKRHPGLKILISLEGRASDFAVDAQPENRPEFVRSCINMYLRGKFAEGVNQPGLFDGIDLDWESPHNEDAANFQGLIAEFRSQMDVLRPGLRLSVAVGASPRMLQGTDFKAIAPLVDEVGVMNYDYAGPWSTTTGFIAPLFAGEATRDEEGTIDKSIAAYREAGIPARKLLMGLPFYGYGWTGVAADNNGLFQSGRGVRGDRPYSYIRTLALPAQKHRDPRSQAPWLFDGQNFWTYEDPVSIRFKVSYAARQNLGGVMIWDLSGDTSDGELMSSLYLALHHPLPSRTFTRLLASKSRNSQEKSGGSE